MGLLPGYQTIGVLAPIGLTLLRVVQGLSVGGEYPSSMVFLVERAPEGRRGLMGALVAASCAIGTLLARQSAQPLPPACQPQRSTPGAGASVLAGLVVGIAGYILRRHVLETGVAEKRMRAPIVETLHALGVWLRLRRFVGLQLDLLHWLCLYVSWLQIADGIRRHARSRSTRAPPSLPDG